MTYVIRADDSGPLPIVLFGISNTINSLVAVLTCLNTVIALEPV